MQNNRKDLGRNKALKTKKGDNNEQTKKPFDKKTYRLKKYSNKYKVDQWEDRRKKAVLRQYYKDLQKGQKNAAHLKTESKDNDTETSNPQPKGNAFHAAKIEYLKKKDEKKNRREEAQRKKEEKIEALRKYREEKALKYKKLSKKTKKGQPVMKDRLEMLLEKIQQTS
ncbi:rRNA-processing protein FYV7 [Neodiprion fabricii]|uniref:rRNA-processing protein FYV7 n=1 Tax=Neodiprion fabricii TaxID=2872261 RepID=UPI001ED95A96|nr:rRNA-processing protein FYV7 [Neodiprion fabricii]